MTEHGSARRVTTATPVRMNADLIAADGAGPVPGSVKSAQRTVELLEFFANHRGRHSLAELQVSLGYPKSSLYMLLQTLTQCGWVETDSNGVLYGIGLRALRVGTSYIDGDDVVAAARDTLDWLNETTGETVHLGRLDGTDVVYLTTRESKHYLRPTSRVGRRLPAHSTAMGKALLADRSDEELNALLPRDVNALTPSTLVDRNAIRADLVVTRRRGYAVDHQENTVGLKCFGVSLRHRQPARDAISCSVPIARLTPGREDELINALLIARDRLKQSLT